jgi:hypothetical protein
MLYEYYFIFLLKNLSKVYYGHHPPHHNPTKRSRDDKTLNTLRKRVPRRRHHEPHQSRQVNGPAPSGVRQPSKGRLEGRGGQHEGRREPQRRVGRVEVQRDDRVARRHKVGVEYADKVP